VRGEKGRARKSFVFFVFRRFLSIIAVSVEIALTTSMAIIQSGSCSYIIIVGDSLQFATTAGIVVLFSIMSTDYVLLLCAIYNHAASKLYSFVKI